MLKYIIEIWSNKNIKNKKLMKIKFYKDKIIYWNKKIIKNNIKEKFLN